MPTAKGQPAKASAPAGRNAVAKSSKKSYASEGVKDNDIFLLPAEDYQVMGAMTAIAFAVRLFRIYQPSSVVFDEVQ